MQKQDPEQESADLEPTLGGIEISIRKRNI